jgi:hypothetical protein
VRRRTKPPIVIPCRPDPLEKAAYAGLEGEIVQTIEPHTESNPGAMLVQLLIELAA